MFMAALSVLIQGYLAEKLIRKLSRPYGGLGGFAFSHQRGALVKVSLSIQGYLTCKKTHPPRTLP